MGVELTAALPARFKTPAAFRATSRWHRAESSEVGRKVKYIPIRALGSINLNKVNPRNPQPERNPSKVAKTHRKLVDASIRFQLEVKRCCGAHTMRKIFQILGGASDAFVSVDQ